MKEKDYSVNTGYPVRTKNFIQPLINGEDAWKKVYEAINEATKSIHLCFWSLQSNLELIREKTESITNPNVREKYTLYKLLYVKAKSGVKVRILLWKYPFVERQGFGDALISSSVGTFEVIYQPHPTLVGTWHQKTIIIDDEIAFVGGMNARENDWDSSDHNPIDLRRADYNLSKSERAKIWHSNDYESLNPPRHDYMVQLKGELVFDVHSNFVERWNSSIENKYSHYKKATKIDPPVKKLFGSSAIKAQIIRTFPSLKTNDDSTEKSVLDTYLNAIELAEKYIYIEDQYFRSEKIAYAIASSIKKNENLIVIIVTPPDYLYYTQFELVTPLVTINSYSSYWTSKSFEIIQKAQPEFEFFFLQSSFKNDKSKRIFVPVDLHAKLMIIDDEWFTIGSCNINDRGFTLDGELNVAVQDLSAKELRKQIFKLHFRGKECPDDIYEAMRLWYELCADNYKIWKNNSTREPNSLIYSYKQNGMSPIKFTHPLLYPLVDWFNGSSLV